MPGNNLWLWYLAHLIQKVTTVVQNTHTQTMIPSTHAYWLQWLCSQPPPTNKQPLLILSLSNQLVLCSSVPWHTDRHTHTHTHTRRTLSSPKLTRCVNWRHTLDKGRHHSRQTCTHVYTHTQVHTNTYIGPSRGGSCIPVQAHRHTSPRLSVGSMGSTQL